MAIGEVQRANSHRGHVADAGSVTTTTTMLIGKVQRHNHVGTSKPIGCAVQESFGSRTWASIMTLAFQGGARPRPLRPGLGSELLFSSLTYL
jgi:hypothetical protein